VAVELPAAGETLDAGWLRAARRARLLSWVSLGWMALEGAVAITAGIVAGSIALVGFGIDSAIEGFASVVIVWRFTGARLRSHTAELRAQRLVAVQFFVLAPYVGFEAVRQLASGERPEVSVVGMALTASSLVGMSLLGVWKRRLALQLGSLATHGEGTQNLLCAALAAATLVGLAGNALLGLWWLDPLVALAIAGVALREGLATWHGEGCCAALAPAPGAGADRAGCTAPTSPANGGSTRAHDACACAETCVCC